MSNIAFVRAQLEIIVHHRQVCNTKELQVPGLIKHVRTAKKLTQAQLAEALNTEKSYISQIERGERGASLVFLEHLLAYLGEDTHV
jgi:DNA-binding XRE family transcriptional regulator